MNERIRELAEQAKKYSIDKLDETGELHKYYDVYFEKFAKLIVQECADLYTHDDVMAPVGQSAWGEAYQDGWIEGTKIYRETILEHFGVK
jgi:hypothetical protein